MINFNKIEDIDSKIETKVMFGEGTYEISTYFKDYDVTNVTLMVDTKRHQYYIIQSNNDLSSKDGVAYLTERLRVDILDKIAEYSNKESLTYRSNPNARDMLCGPTIKDDKVLLENFRKLFSDISTSYKEHEILSEKIDYQSVYPFVR